MANILITDYGASPSQPDNAPIIQGIIDNKVKDGDSMVVPSGKFNISPSQCNQRRWGIRLKSNMTLQINKDAILAALPSKYEDTNMVYMEAVENVTIVGPGIIRGERYIHQGQGGEHGHCVRVTQGCEDINLLSFVADSAWGDGIMIDNMPPATKTFGPPPSKVMVNQVNSNMNRRQGMSVASVSGLEVHNSLFSNIGGTAPGCGIDLETDVGTQVIENVNIDSNTFMNLQGSNIAVGSPHGIYRNIRIGPNTYDMKKQPIWVSQAAGSLNAPWWAVLMHGIFGGWTGYPTQWHS